MIRCDYRCDECNQRGHCIESMREAFRPLQITMVAVAIFGLIYLGLLVTAPASTIMDWLR